MSKVYDISTYIYAQEKMSKVDDYKMSKAPFENSGSSTGAFDLHLNMVTLFYNHPLFGVAMAQTCRS